VIDLHELINPSGNKCLLDYLEHLFYNIDESRALLNTYCSFFSRSCKMVVHARWVVWCIILSPKETLLSIACPTDYGGLGKCFTQLFHLFKILPHSILYASKRSLVYNRSRAPICHEGAGSMLVSCYVSQPHFTWSGNFHFASPLETPGSIC
jgi:hypothetical protein